MITILHNYATMAPLSALQAFNARVSLPRSLVAVFVGATSGIGRATLLALSRYADSPRIYFLGRSQSAADQIVTQCKAVNPRGEYIFMQADVSLLRVVDSVCADIKRREQTLDLLFLSQGVMDMSRTETAERIHLLASLNYYSRMRFITNLLPLLSASSLRRVVAVAGGGMEGPLDVEDIPALRVPLPQLRGHLSSLITLGLEQVAKTADKVSFVHVYPGSVNTGLYRDMSGPPFDPADGVSLDECGERHVYVATSPHWARDGEGKGTDGKIGSGVYSVGSDSESKADEIAELLAGMRERGVDELIWGHTEAEFRRVADM